MAGTRGDEREKREMTPASDAAAMIPRFTRERCDQGRRHAALAGGAITRPRPPASVPGSIAELENTVGRAADTDARVSISCSSISGTAKCGRSSSGRALPQRLRAAEMNGMMAKRRRADRRSASEAWPGEQEDRACATMKASSPATRPAADSPDRSAR